MSSSVTLVKVAQSCPTPCDPTDYTVHGILQARILEGASSPFSDISTFRTCNRHHDHPECIGAKPKPRPHETPPLPHPAASLLPVPTDTRPLGPHTAGRAAPVPVCPASSTAQGPPGSSVLQQVSGRPSFPRRSQIALPAWTALGLPPTHQVLPRFTRCECCRCERGAQASL